MTKAQSLLQAQSARKPNRFYKAHNRELAIRGNQSGQQRPAEAIRLRPSSRESTHLGGRLGARVAIRTTHDSLGEGGEGGTGGEGEAEKGKRRQRSASEARASKQASLLSDRGENGGATEEARVYVPLTAFI